MTTVQTIIDAAYNRSTANNPGKLAQDDELIAHLNRVYQRTWSEAARGRPDRFSATIPLTLIGAPPSVALPASDVDVMGFLNASGAPVWLIPITERFRSWHIAPSVYRQGDTIVSRNKAGDPIAGDVLTTTLLDAPAALTTLASTLDARWPARHEQLLVDYLAYYLIVKDAGRSSADAQKLAADLRTDVSAFANDFALTPAAVNWIHADVERHGDPSP